MTRRTVTPANASLNQLRDYVPAASDAPTPFFNMPPPEAFAAVASPKLNKLTPGAQTDDQSSFEQSPAHDEVVIIASSPDPRGRVSFDLHSPEPKSDTSHDETDGLRSPAHHEDEVGPNDRASADDTILGASSHGAPSPVEETEKLARRLKRRDKKGMKQNERRKQRKQQEKSQRRKEAALQQQEASTLSDSMVNEQHAEEVRALEAEMSTSQNHPNERYHSGKRRNSETVSDNLPPGHELTWGMEALNRLYKPAKATRQDLQNAAEQLCTKTKAVKSTTKIKSTKVRKHQEVVFDISSDDDVGAIRLAKKRKLDGGPQHPLDLPRPPKLTSTVNSSEPRVAAHARAPKPTSPLPMLVNGRVTNALHPEYHDPSSSSSSSDDDGEDSRSLQTAESRQSTALVQSRPLTLNATHNVRPLPMLETRANIDPAS